MHVTSSIRVLPLAATLFITSGCSGSGRANDGRSVLDAGVADTNLITWTKDGQNFGLYAPAGASHVPVMMYLHGCTMDPIASPPWLVSALQTSEPVAVFLPKRPESEGCSAWGGTYDDALRPAMVATLAELDRVVREHGFDTSRQYIYGDSMGAEGVFQLLVEYPDRFAAAVAVSGYSTDTGASAMAKTPLWIIHGSADSVNAVESVRTLYASILAAGGTRVKYTEYEGLDHVPTIVQAASEPGLVDWILAQRR